MEVSSHALALARVDELTFDIAMFTNLTQDHLDFHGTLDAYRAAKRRLFELLARSPKSRRTGVVNADDPAGAEMTRGLGLTVLTFGLGSRADVRALRHESTLDGIRLTATTPRGRLELTSPLIGEHNVMNLLGAIGTGIALGVVDDALVRVLGAVDTVPGRFEQVRAGQPFLVVVDYAHTPDALEKSLLALQPLARSRGGELWCVFGCGGNRDAGKRPLMGALAQRLANRVVVTSDNPRHESPSQILEQIVAGMTGTHKPMIIEDRRVAIGQAIRFADASDVILIAGKGHEDYQDVAGVKHPFSDVVEAREMLARKVGVRRP
jgi:UDP-N-acetylmuramoyl-L-alanyl-D-glutamate--2,6-diaminopimelate ligase